MSFNLDDYEPVASRVQRFYADHPNGAIHTEIIHDDGERVVIKATVWRNMDDKIPAAVDYAEEILTQRGVNSTSRIENACTSAAGRAISIAAAGLSSSDPGKKPTREEMAKVRRIEDHRSRAEAPRSPQEPRKDLGGARAASEGQITLIKSMMTERGLELTIPESLTFQDASEIITELKKTPKVK